MCSAIRPKKEVAVGSEYYPRNCTSESVPGSAFCIDCGEQIRLLGTSISTGDDRKKDQHYLKGKYLNIMNIHKPYRVVCPNSDTLP